jgi:hypothetical protein
VAGEITPGTTPGTISTPIPPNTGTGFGPAGGGHGWLLLLGLAVISFGAGVVAIARRS